MRGEINESWVRALAVLSGVGLLMTLVLRQAGVTFENGYQMGNLQGQQRGYYNGVSDRMDYERSLRSYEREIKTYKLLQEQKQRLHPQLSMPNQPIEPKAPQFNRPLSDFTPIQHNFGSVSQGDWIGVGFLAAIFLMSVYLICRNRPIQRNISDGNLMVVEDKNSKNNTKKINELFQKLENLKREVLITERRLSGEQKGLHQTAATDLETKEEGTYGQDENGILCPSDLVSLLHTPVRCSLETHSYITSLYSSLNHYNAIPKRSQTLRQSIPINNRQITLTVASDIQLEVIQNLNNRIEQCRLELTANNQKITEQRDSKAKSKLVGLSVSSSEGRRRHRKKGRYSEHTEKNSHRRSPSPS